MHNFFINILKMHQKMHNFHRRGKTKLDPLNLFLTVHVTDTRQHRHFIGKTHPDTA